LGSLFFGHGLETQGSKPICPIQFDGKIEPPPFKVQTCFEIIDAFPRNFPFDIRPLLPKEQRIWESEFLLLG
jgi:hypothetical protein